MRELETVSKELKVAIERGQENQDKEAAHRLAAEQTRLLRQLMRINSRLRENINNVLDPSQRKKLNALERSNEVSVREGN
jgi:Spy/CpxP family protein refolding chaperone